MSLPANRIICAMYLTGIRRDFRIPEGFFEKMEHEMGIKCDPEHETGVILKNHPYRNVFEEKGRVCENTGRRQKY